MSGLARTPAPPAPTVARKTRRETVIWNSCSGCVHGPTRRNPVPPPSGHREHFLVSHRSQRVAGERGAEPAAAVQDDLGVLVRPPRLDVALDDALAEVYRAGDVTDLPLAV